MRRGLVITFAVLVAVASLAAEEENGNDIKSSTNFVMVSEDETANENVEKEVVKALKESIDIWNKGDLNAFMKIYEDDVIFYYPGHLIKASKDAIRDVLEKKMVDPDLQLEIQGDVRFEFLVHHMASTLMTVARVDKKDRTASSFQELILWKKNDADLTWYRSMDIVHYVCSTAPCERGGQSQT